jgi:uncharacterized membrane protein (DUF106 family)
MEDTDKKNAAFAAMKPLIVLIIGTILVFIGKWLRTWAKDLETQGGMDDEAKAAYNRIRKDSEDAEVI